MRERIASPAEERVRRIKRKAVLEVYLREGPFWEAVLAMRRKWEIEPAVGLPRAGGTLPAPGPNADPFDGRCDQWPSDIAVLALGLGRKRFYRAADWRTFAAALVLLDPPETNEGRDLLAFAEYGEISAAPVVRRVPSRAQSQQKLVRYYDAVIDGLVRRYVEPAGKSGPEALEEILREGDLEEILREQVDAELGVFPDEHSTKGEYDAALKEIRSNRGGGRMDGLVAVVCAGLVDDHNSTDPQDRRIKRYTNKALAREFADDGVKNERSAKAHVKRGRELRRAREQNFRES